MNRLMLNSRNTHLPLRDRARVALRSAKRRQQPLPADFNAKLQRALYLRANAVRYQERKFPGWPDLPEELRQQLRDGFPLSGYGMADLNTLLSLMQRADEAEAELTVPDPDVSDVEIDAAVKDHLQRRGVTP
jgi:hypothetical protein